MISTHILDTSKGNPAGGINVRLSLNSGGTWSDVGNGITDPDGRHAFACDKTPGLYKLTFEVEPYLKKSGGDFFFPVAEVTFQITDTNRKYHVPLLLNPFGYSTYRGS